ncbi:MAG TPA: ABC transporter permease [Candidatus Baltobacteraceae bacterium]|nr:ABC transporter permease [Candidatus Baltobacteraceae bacterium]
MTARLPTFLDALKAVWLLTWKSQWATSRLPIKLGSLLVLPALVLLTVLSPEKWTQRQNFFGNPDAQLDSFYRRLERHQIPMEATQKAGLRQIMRDEYARAQASWSEQPGQSPDARKQRLQDHLDATGTRILERAREFLDERQMAEFQTWEQRTRETTVARLSAIQTPWGRTTPFYHWLLNFYFFIILPLTCVRACGALIRDELQADTLGFLITRPVSRARLLIVKYIAQVLWLEMLLLVETLLLFATGVERQIPGLAELLPLLLGVQFLAVPAWSALGTLLGQITSRYMATALIYGAVVEMGIGRIPTNINTLSLLRHIETLLSRNGTLEGIFVWDVGGTWTAILALVLAPFIFVGAAAVLFSIVEYHASAEMQK